VAKVGIGTGRLLEQLLFFSVPFRVSRRTVRSLAVFPFSKKISLLHSHVLFLLCVELNLVFVMGSCQFLFLLCL